ncbi:diflavin oxidoreductase [Elongatibacter sediminis]|uniref:Flavodoxin domain-containing protein n=1 Tax=Elongatibacter sediminis TaxID=3119006 RepID=A0AAW9RNF8_9GAMM
MFQALRTDNSPFTELQIQQLQQGLTGLDATQSAWLSGFIAGRLASGGSVPEAVVQPAAVATPAETLHVLYASQTGNGEVVAEELAERARQAGFAVELQSMGSTRPAAIKKIRHAAFVISTHGEGDPPDDAVEWFEYLSGSRAPALKDLKFSVLALGDRSYSEFCAAGVDFEKLLTDQGAATFSTRTDCDVDYEALATEWSGSVVEYGREHLATESGAASTAAVGRLSVVPQAPRWTRANPFAATVERVQKITGLESSKHVYHLELSLEDAGLDYEPGDSLGVWAPNDHDLVARVIDRLGVDADESVEVDAHRHSVHELLTRHRELTRLSADTVTGYAERAGRDDLAAAFEGLDDAGRRDFIEQRQFIDLVEAYPPAGTDRFDAAGLATLLRPLAPRSYSIASSGAAVGEEVHLTVATLFSDAIGSERKGVASHYLNHHVKPGDEVPVFLEPNRRFRLPEDRSLPLILVAAGTGIAPYRAFLQQLEEEGANPDVWLVFGNPHLRTDFLYQREWLEWRKRGLVTRIDGAFSRDQEEKRYVQHVVRDEAVRVNEWLDRGAHLYLCGGLSMGKAVEQSVQQALALGQGLSDEGAAEAFAELRRQGRLLKDLY